MGGFTEKKSTTETADESQKPMYICTKFTLQCMKFSMAKSAVGCKGFHIL